MLVFFKKKSTLRAVSSFLTEKLARRFLLTVACYSLSPDLKPPFGEESQKNWKAHFSALKNFKICVI